MKYTKKSNCIKPELLVAKKEDIMIDIIDKCTYNTNFTIL